MTPREQMARIIDPTVFKALDNGHIHPNAWDITQAREKADSILAMQRGIVEGLRRTGSADSFNCTMDGHHNATLASVMRALGMEKSA